MQGRAPTYILGVLIRITGQESINNFDMALFSGSVQGGNSAIHRRVRVGAGLEQRGHDPNVAFPGSCEEGSASLSILCVWIRAGIKEGGNDLGAAFFGLPFFIS